MEAIVPEKGAGIDKETIYWDHLAIMADFELDVDYPEGTITKEAIQHEAQKPSIRATSSSTATMVTSSKG